MNLPNKLTLLRIIMAPVFLVTLMLEFPHHYLVALILFCAASITDLIDGKYARKHNMITDFGKFLDPLADKMLTTAAFLGFIKIGVGQGIVFITFIVLLREFLITSMRLVVAGNGKVVAANIWGKAKTVSQMVSIIVAILAEYIMSFGVLSDNICSTIGYAISGLLWVSAGLTIISGVLYLIENLQFVDYRK